MADSKEVEVTRKPTRAAAGEDTYAPLVDIFESPDGKTVVLAEMPGASERDVEIRVDKGVLTIEAEGRVPEPQGQYTRTYVGFGGVRYFRAFALSDEIDRDGIAASLADGVLRLELPKSQAARSRKIEIKAG